MHKAQYNDFYSYVGSNNKLHWDGKFGLYIVSISIYVTQAVKTQLKSFFCDLLLHKIILHKVKKV